MLRILLIGLALLFVIIIIGFFIYVNTGIQLPDHTNKTIKDVLANEDHLPEFIKGKTGFAKNGTTRLWYEVLGEPGASRGTILLISGAGVTAMAWPVHFYQPLIDAGYQVIRYDNRGLGESSWIEDWSKENAYALEDMAKDGLAVLDDAGVNKAHIIGVSMGGMIAQRMAISHSDRVCSLTSIMASAYMFDESLPAVSGKIISDITKLSLKYLLFNPKETAGIKYGIGLHQILKGDGPYKIDSKAIAEQILYEIRKRKGFNLKVSEQHIQAITKSGSRLEALKNLSLPTLVIHGKSDPVVHFKHAQKYAASIPNAETLLLDGMGHDLPQIYMVQIQEAILELVW